MKCPVCKLSTGFYQQERIKPGTFLQLPYPLYQKSYPGELEYISPRCERCYDKAERKLRQKAERDLAKLT